MNVSDDFSKEESVVHIKEFLGNATYYNKKHFVRESSSGIHNDMRLINNPVHDKNVETTEQNPRTRNSINTIIYWTRKNGADDWTWGSGTSPFQRCEYKNCQMTTNKQEVIDAEMLLFYCKENPNFPEVRHPHQLYVHFSREPPFQVTRPGYAQYSDVINMTVSYRHDGNMQAPYFKAERRTGSRVHYDPNIRFLNKTRSVFWMTSNCVPDSKRDVYVKKLQQYIDVDVYGLCGNYTCELDTQRRCFSELEAEYKFYLSLENAICQDYYTEKLSNPLQHEIVPIVFGGASYERDLPEQSFINVVDFPHPKDLARFLNEMTETEYYEYFRWKSDYIILQPGVPCKLCEFLNSATYLRGDVIRPPYKGDYSTWMYQSCDNSLMNTLRKKGNW